MKTKKFMTTALAAFTLVGAWALNEANHVLVSAETTSTAGT